MYIYILFERGRRIMNHVSSVANMIHASVDSCVSHINEADEALSRRRVDDGCVHLQNAFGVAKFILVYAIQSGTRNSPVVSQALERLRTVINTLDEISRIQGWGDKCTRYMDKKRKLGSNYENVSVDMAQEVRTMKRMIM